MTLVAEVAEVAAAEEVAPMEFAVAFVAAVLVAVDEHTDHTLVDHRKDVRVDSSQQLVAER